MDYGLLAKRKVWEMEIITEDLGRPGTINLRKRKAKETNGRSGGTY
jgi:hypothetical protein